MNQPICGTDQFNQFDPFNPAAHPGKKTLAPAVGLSLLAIPPEEQARMAGIVRTNLTDAYCAGHSLAKT